MTRGVSLLILTAKRLAEALQDPLCMSQLKSLHFNIQNKIQAMELNKSALEDNHTYELRVIKLQQEELDQKKKQLRAKIINSDKENKTLMSLLIKESIRRKFNDKKKVPLMMIWLDLRQRVMEQIISLVFQIVSFYRTDYDSLTARPLTNHYLA